MEKISNPEKWQGKVSTRLTRARPDQIWPLFTDFFNLHRWLPTLSTCHGVHGNNGEPGCIRFCSSSSLRSNGQDSSAGWSKERLVAVDHADRVMSYEIVDCNVGFESYVSTVKISAGGGDAGVDGCEIEWVFTVDPVEGWALEDLVKKYEKALGLIAKNMEDSLIEN